MTVLCSVAGFEQSKSLILNQPHTVNDFVSFKSYQKEAPHATLSILPFSCFLVQPWVKNSPPYHPMVVFKCKLSLCMSAKCLLWMHSVYLVWLHIANPMAGHFAGGYGMSLSPSLRTKPTILPRLYSLTPRPWLTTKFCLTQTSPLTWNFQISLWSARDNLANNHPF